MTDPIDTSSLTFKQNKEELIEYIKNKPESEGWKDTDFESGPGATVVELIAGLGSLLSFRELMRVQESYIETAKHERSIIELGFNRGFFVPPTQTHELILTITPNISSTIQYMDKICLGVNEEHTFNCYAMELKTLSPGVSTELRVVCGNLRTFEQELTGIKPYTTISFVFADDFVASRRDVNQNELQMESLLINGDVSIPLRSDLNYTREYGSDFLLRRTAPNKVIIYIGNGVLGWYMDNITSLKYQCITYSEGMFEGDLSFAPEMDISIDGFVTPVSAVYGMDKEEIRVTSIFYPLDGRVVSDPDYEAVIKKYFGGVLKDIYSYNTDPDQQLYLLTEDTFAQYHSDNIASLIDSKRGPGINVLYTILDPQDGYTFLLRVKVEEASIRSGLETDVQKYLNEKLFKFWRTEETLTSQSLSIELSAKFGIEFTQINNESVDLVESSFFQLITLDITS